MKLKRKVWIVLFLFFLLPCVASGQDFKKWEAKIAEYEQWLDLLRSDGYHFWVKLDSTPRPHRLYVGEGFHKADYRTKKQFVEIFSSYLTGHPEKFMLIDIFDAVTEKPIGEFGWGGFKLYSERDQESGNGR